MCAVLHLVSKLVWKKIVCSNICRCWFSRTCEMFPNCTCYKAIYLKIFGGPRLKITGYFSTSGLSDLSVNIPYITIPIGLYVITNFRGRAFAHGAMGRRIDPSWGGPIELFLIPASAPRLCNKGRGLCYPVCGMVHIKEPLLLIDKSSLCGGSRFPFSLSEWSLNICLMPYNRR